MVAAFIKGMTTSPFSDSLIQNKAKTLFEVRKQVTTHIKAEEDVLRKNDSSRSKQSRYKESSCDRSSRKDETSIVREQTKGTSHTLRNTNRTLKPTRR